MTENKDNDNEKDSIDEVEHIEVQAFQCCPKDAYMNLSS